MEKGKHTGTGLLMTRSRCLTFPTFECLRQSPLADNAPLLVGPCQDFLPFPTLGFNVALFPSLALGADNAPPHVGHNARVKPLMECSHSHPADPLK